MRVGNKNKSLSSNEKSQKPKDGKGKKDKKSTSEKKEISVFINEQEADKIVKSAKVITIHELAKQANVKISTANVFMKKSLANGDVRKVGGFSGHYVYQSVSE